MTELDPRPFRNRFDDSRWPDDGGAPDMLLLDPRPEYNQWLDAYAHLLSLDPNPCVDTQNPDGWRFERLDPERPSIVFAPRPGHSQDRARYPDIEPRA